MSPNESKVYDLKKDGRDSHKIFIASISLDKVTLEYCLIMRPNPKTLKIQYNDNLNGECMKFDVEIYFVLKFRHHKFLNWRHRSYNSRCCCITQNLLCRQLLT